MKVSIDGYSFHGLLEEGKMDIFGYLESLKYRYGVDGAGIWNGFFPGMMERRTPDADLIKKVKEALDDREMVVPNIACDWCCVWNDDAEQRAIDNAFAWEQLKAAAALGAKSIRIDWGVHNKELTEQEFDYIVEMYKKYCAFAKDYGMRVGPENHFGASLNSDLMIKVAEAVDDPAYGILLHLNRWVDEDKIAADHKLVKYAVHTHVDMNIAPFNLEERLLGVYNAGFRGWWGMEHGRGKDEYEESAVQLALVKRAVAALPKEEK